MEQQNGYRIGGGQNAGPVNGSGQKAHMLILDGRKRLEVTGVNDVLRFDDAFAELSTDLGTLIVEGEGLRIEVFDTSRGTVTLCGAVRTLDYDDGAPSADPNPKKRGLFGKR